MITAKEAQEAYRKWEAENYRPDEVELQIEELVLKAASNGAGEILAPISCDKSLIDKLGKEMERRFLAKGFSAQYFNLNRGDPYDGHRDNPHVWISWSILK